MREYDLIIVGGGASGMLCLIDAKNKGIENVLLIEKDPCLGGALNLGNYNISKVKNINGKEYKEELLKQINKLNVELKLNTMVLKIENDREVLCLSPSCGVEKVKGKSIILANGGKEKSRNVLDTVGDRCAGIYTIGMAKKVFNMNNMIPGKNIFIFGDDNLYMIEKELKEHDINIVGIATNESNKEVYNLTDKLYKGYKLLEIKGENRICGVTIAKDIEELHIDCDALIFAQPMLSDGVVAMRSDIQLNPKTTGPKVNENFMTSKEGIFACGNGIFIHESIEDIENECKHVIDSIDKFLS